MFHCPCSDLSDAIRTLKKELMNPDDSSMCLEVRRDCLLVDCVREARKKKFNPKKHLKVF